jgi:ferric-dicitrate binding protein FerR (iron transport regulator)
MHDRYLSYSAEELATDEKFIRWVKSETDEKGQWQSWLDAHPGMASTVKQARQMVEDMRFASIDTGDAAERIWGRIEHSVASPESTSPPAKIRRISTLRIATLAAAVMALVLIVRALLPSQATFETSYGQAMTVSLPDRSAVELNDGSILSYRKKSFDSDRVIQLEGEAFFEVTSGSTFLVETPRGTVEVLGTSFNVYSRPDGFRVHCHTGSVSVASEGETQILKPGEWAHLQQDDQLQKDSFDLNRDDWRVGTFQYAVAPLCEVCRELERQFDVAIKLEAGLEQLQYSGFFESGDLETALYQVCWPLKLESEILENNQVIIRLSKE